MEYYPDKYIIYFSTHYCFQQKTLDWKCYLFKARIACFILICMPSAWVVEFCPLAGHKAKIPRSALNAWLGSRWCLGLGILAIVTAPLTYFFSL